MRMWYRFNRCWAHVHLVALYRMRAYGRENVPLDRSVLMVCNHQSYLDPMIAASPLLCEVDFTPRANLFKNRLFAAFLRSLNSFPIERDQADIGAIKGIIKRLQQGRTVLLFPEGTRTADGRITAFKPGLDLIARRAGVATVPVVIEGGFEIWPRHRPWPGPGRLSVMYGQPITVAETEQMTRQEFVNLVNQRLRQLQQQLCRMVGKEPYEYPE